MRRGASLSSGRTIDSAEPEPEVPPTLELSDAWFAAGMCRNCGAAQATPYCGTCGQKAAKRLALGTIATETWDRVRLFEMSVPKTLRRLVLSPGTVAREYVLGRRTAHMHPLKLLVALVAVLVLLLAANRYFQHYNFAGRDVQVDRMAERVMAYANWSFSLGIFAIFIASWTVFHGRLGTNAVEHAVLAIYCQILILAAIILNLLPTLIWTDPAFILRHKQASAWYLYAIKLLIVSAAYKQFFLVRLRSEWPRLLLACAIYAGLSWLLLRLYARLILWLVS